MGGWARHLPFKHVFRARGGHASLGRAGGHAATGTERAARMSGRHAATGRRVGHRRAGPVGRTAGQAACAEPEFGAVDGGRGQRRRRRRRQRFAGAAFLFLAARSRDRGPAAAHAAVRVVRPSAARGRRPFRVLFQIAPAAPAAARLVRHLVGRRLLVHHGVDRRHVVVDVDRGPRVLDGGRRVRGGRGVLHVGQHQPFPGVEALAVHVPAGRATAVAARDARVQVGSARIVRSDGRGPDDAIAGRHATLFVSWLLLLLMLVQLERWMLEQLFYGRGGGRSEQIGEMTDTVKTHGVPPGSHSTTTTADDHWYYCYGGRRAFACRATRRVRVVRV